MIFVQEILEGIDNLRNLCIDSETEACPGLCPNDKCAVQILYNKLLKHGRWIVETDCEGKTRRCICNQCGFKTGRYTWENPEYCSNCGAKMDEVEDDNNNICNCSV